MSLSLSPVPPLSLQVLVNAEQKAELEAALAAEQAKVDTAAAALAEAEAALSSAAAAAASATSQVASERSALLAAAEELQKREFEATAAQLAGLEMYYMVRPTGTCSLASHSRIQV